MAALIDLPLVLDLSQELLAARRVRSLTERSLLALPPLAIGSDLACTLRLCDSAGAILDESGAAGQTPILLISRYDPDTGQEVLALVTTFTPIATDPKGWSFDLALNSEALYAYLGTSGESRQAVFELSLASTGRLRPLLRRALTLLPPVASGEEAAPVALLTPILRPDLTSAALHRAVLTAGRNLPVVYLTLEDGLWQCWTLRTRVDGEVDDGTTYRLPADWHASTNNVIWVKTALA